MFIDIAVAVPAAKVRHRGAPGRGVGFAGGNVGGDLGAREIPYRDCLVRPFRGVDAAPDGVEARAVGAAVRGHVGASCVFLLSRGVAVAVGRVDSRQTALVPDAAAGIRVQRHLIRRVRVHALDDIDLARRRPRPLAQQPECGPGATAGGHVRDIRHEKPFVERLFGNDAHAAAAGGGLGLVIHTQVSRVPEIRDLADELGGCGRGVVGVFDEAVCRVGVAEGGEVAEEGVFGVVVREGVGGGCAVDEEGGGEEGGEGGGMHGGLFVVVVIYRGYECTLYRGIYAGMN